MYCGDCSGQLRQLVGPRPREGCAGADRFGNLQCQRCGLPLPAETPDGTLDRKMAQLAKFGLAEPGPPAAGGA